MSSESLQELLAEIKAHPDGSDLLITALYTAAHHYRRSTICTPFPPESILPLLPNSKDRDHAALQQTLQAVPAVHSLLGDVDVLRGLPPQALAVLQWLLHNPARRRRFSLVPLGDLVRQLRQRSGGIGGWQLPVFAGGNSPAYVLRAHEGCAQEPFSHGAIAYHGTHLENLHSIIHTGLQNMSGTRLQRTGANFGAGIYLSTNYDTAFSFCQPCDTWPRSRFGSKLRVLLVCEVDMDECTTERGADLGSNQGASVFGTAAVPRAPPPSSSSSSSLPDTYLLVRRADAVRLLFVMVFCDAPPRAARATRVNWCTVMVVLYATFLLGKALLAALRQHRY